MRRRGPGMVAADPGSSQYLRLPFASHAGRPPRTLVDPGRRDPHPARARADGGRQRAGVSAPGAGASAQGSSARRWSAAPASSTATSGRSAISASRPTSTRSRSRSSAPSRARWPKRRGWSRRPGADLVDINFGCPVRKVTKTGAGATLLDEPARACAIVEAVANAVDVPVSVKMRRGLRDGSRTCLEVGPKLVEAGAATLTLHPRSAQQMYTGSAEHALTAELVSLVDVPVIASGDITSRAKAQSVLATTGAAAVMVGPRRAGQPVGAPGDRRRRRRADRREKRSWRSSSSSSARPSASSASAARPAS